MQILESNIQQRRQNNSFYAEIIQNIDGVSTHKEPSDQYFSNYWLTTILIDPKISNKSSSAFRQFLESRNIESRPVWKPLHLQNIFKNYEYFGNNIAENIFNSGLCLPSGADLSPPQKEKIKTAFLDFFLA